MNEIIIAMPIKNLEKKYSGDPEITIANRKYSLRYKVKYNNGEITKFSKYGSEGVIDYPIAELKADTAIYRSINIPLRQEWKVGPNALLGPDGSEIKLIKLDNFHYKESDGSRIFVIK